MKNVLQVDTVVLHVGTNDLATPKLRKVEFWRKGNLHKSDFKFPAGADIARNLCRAAEKLLAETQLGLRRVVVSVPLPRHCGTGTRLTASCLKKLRQNISTDATAPVALFDGAYQPMDDDTAAARYYGRDGLHLNKNGSMRFAQLLSQFILALDRTSV